MRKHINLPSLTTTQAEIVNGLLLGDGTLCGVRGTNWNWRFRHDQSEYDNDKVDKITYMQYIFNYLQPYSSKLSKCYNKNRIENINGKIINHYGEITGQKYSITTHCHPTWTELSKKWYLWKNNELVLRNNRIIKVIPYDLILTPLTICIWLMDDGTVDAKRGNIALCTNGFTFQECKQLSEFMKRDMGILSKVKIKVTGPVICLGVEYYKKLLELVKPYVKWNCFKYKINDSYNKIHQQGESHSQSKLTESQIKDIIKLYKKGIWQKEIAKQFNISQPAVSHIVSGKQWNHLKLGKQGRTFKKLCINQKVAIKNMFINGMKQKDIAKEFNIDQSTVSKVVNE